MKPLVLLKDPKNAILTKNVDVLMRAFKSGTFTPNHLPARFSNPSLSFQNGFFQQLNGIVYIYIEICPDKNNPFGGGATVSFNSGDVLTAPFACTNPQFTISNWIGLNSVVMTQLSNGAKFTNCRVQTNTATGLPEIAIYHNIPATASSFAIEGFYILGA